METKKVFCDKCKGMFEHTMQPVIDNVQYENAKFSVFIQVCTTCKKSTNVLLPM